MALCRTKGGNNITFRGTNKMSNFLCLFHDADAYTVSKDKEIQTTAGVSSYLLSFKERLRKTKKNFKQDIGCTCLDSSGAYAEQKQKR